MIYNSEIEIVEKYKYLGVALFYNGNLKDAANHLSQKKFERDSFLLKSKVLDFDVVHNIPVMLRLYSADLDLGNLYNAEKR